MVLPGIKAIVVPMPGESFFSSPGEKIDSDLSGQAALLSDRGCQPPRETTADR
jgi:hypothetical protein